MRRREKACPFLDKNPVSYVEIEITADKINVFERLQSDKADELVAAAKKFGLNLEKTFRSICG